jgi:hypothetical protein
MSLLLRCTIEDTVFDLDVQEDIPLRLDISSIENGEIGKSFGVGSQTFTLPGSKNNDTFFKAAFNINSVQARGFYRSIECAVIQNSNEVFRGKLFLQEVVTDFEGNNNYQVNVVSEIIDFATLIKDQFIAELDLSDYDHTYTSANITSSWGDSISNGDIFYPLVDYGLDGTGDLNELALGGTNGKVDNADSPMKISQFKPAIRAKAILDKIFDSVNYQYSSSFFDSDDFQKMYVLTTPNDKLGIENQSNQDSGFIATRFGSAQGIPADNQYDKIIFNTEEYDPGSTYDPTTSVFTIGTDGNYAFKSDIQFSRTPDSDDVRADVYISVYVNSLYQFTKKFDVLPYSGGTINYQTPGITLQNGDTVELQARFSGVNLTGPIGDFFIEQDRTVQGQTLKTSFQTIYAPTIVVGGNVNMSQQFDPTLKSLDFIRGLIEKFNLVVEPKTDERNTLIIETFADWRDSGETKDWTDKIDLSQRVSITHPINKQEKTLIFSDIKDDDALNKYSKDNFDSELDYGTEVYTTISDLAQGERKIGSFFAPTPAKGIPGGPQVIVPHLYKIDGGEKKSYKFKPRLLYRIDGQQPIGANGGKIFLQDAQLPDLNLEITEYSTVNHLEALPADASSTKSLHFNSNRWYPFHQNTLNGFTPLSAFNEYWSEYINELYDDEARMLTCNMYFTPQDLVGLRLNDKIFIKDAYYRINKIKGFNVSDDDVVEVELLKAPVRRFKFRRVFVFGGGGPLDFDRDPIGVEPYDFSNNGFVGYRDTSTGAEITSSDIIRNASLQLGYSFVESNVSESRWFDSYNTVLNTAKNNQVGGTVTIAESAGNVVGAADNSEIGQNVDKVVMAGSDITIGLDSKNTFVSGDTITIGEGSIDTSVLSADNVTIGSSSFGVFALGASGSTLGGTRNGMIATKDSCIDCAYASEQVVMIGTENISLFPSSSYTRHVHIGGTDNLFYVENSASFENTVMLGNVAGHNMVAQGYPFTNEVYMGDSVQAGSVRYHIDTIPIGPASTYNVSSHDYTIYTEYTSSTNGNGFIFLPSVSESIGRILHFNTNGSITANDTVTIAASASECNIDGAGPEFTMNRSYDGITITALPSYEWVIINRKSK